MSPGHKTNPHYYALRLKHMLTKEVLWIPPDTTMTNVLLHIANPLCSNSECPNLDKNTITKKSQQKTSSVVSHSNSVWKAELRVRYVPKSLKELYEKDRPTCHFYLNQVKQDYIQSNISCIDQDIAIQICCLGIRHYYKDANVSDKKQHIDYIEKEIRFSNFIPKSVIETIKQKNLKKLIQAGYKKVYNFTEIEYMMKFFDLLRTQYTFDQEQFIVSIGSGWNIPVDLVIGPHVGISYLTHSQGKPTKVTDFQNCERITTYVLATKDTNSQLEILNLKGTSGSSSSSGSGSTGSNITNSPSSNKKNSSSDKRSHACNCSEIKTQLKITVSGEELSITCNGIKTAESIAVLVDGYCRLFKNSDISLWDRSEFVKCTPNSSATNSLEKNNKKESDECYTSTDSIQHEITSNSSPENTLANHSLESHTTPILNEDYAEIGMGEEEGDYSTPAGKLRFIYFFYF